MWQDRGYPRQQEPGALLHASDIPQPLLACSFSTSQLSWFCMQQTRLLVGLSGEHAPPLPEGVSWWIAVNGIYDSMTLFNITY